MTTRSLESIFNYLPGSVQQAVNDDEQILSWANQAFSTVHTPDKFVMDLDVIEIRNYLGELPDNLHRIWRVYKAIEPILEEDLQSCRCDDEDKGAEFPDETIDQSRCMIYHDLLLDAGFLAEKCGAIPYSGLRTSHDYNKHLRGDKCRRVCSESWSLTTDNCHIRTSFTDEPIIVEYLSRAVDGQGLPLVPESPPELWLGLSSYVQAMHWLDRLNLKEEGAMRLYQMHLSQSQIYLQQARSILAGRALNTSLARAQMYAPRRILNAHSLIKPWPV